MKTRGIFAIVSALMLSASKSIANLFKSTPGSNSSQRQSNGRQAFYAISGPRRANQRKNYRKAYAGWNK